MVKKNVTTKKNVTEVEAPVVEPLVVEEEVDNSPYVYNSLTDFTLVLRPTKKVLRQDHNGLPYDYTTKAVKILFRGGMFVLDEKWIAKLDMEIPAIRELIENAPGYPRQFRLVSGPGIVPTEDMISFAERARSFVAFKHGIQTVRGVRGTGARRGR